MTDYFIRKMKMPFEESFARVMKRLRQNGFEIGSVLDMKATFEDALQVRFRNYKLIVVYDPELAFRAASLESHSGSMITWNLVIQEHENGEIEISSENPSEMIERLPANSLHDVLIRLGHKLRTVIDEVKDELPSDDRRSFAGSPRRDLRGGASPADAKVSAFCEANM